VGETLRKRISLPASRKDFPHLLQLALKPPRKHRQPHHLDEADVLFFNVMPPRVYVKEPFRALRGGAVVPEHQIHLPGLFPATADEGYGAVLLSPLGILGEGKDLALAIFIPPPELDKLPSQLFQHPGIFAPQADNREGPPRKLQRDRSVPGSPPDGGILHGEVPGAPLKVIVPENGAPHDGKVPVGAEKHMRKSLQKGADPGDAAIRDGHGAMLPGEKDAVLVVVDVGGELEIPGLPINIQRNEPVVAPLGMPRMPPIAGVLHAEKTEGVRLSRAARISRGSFSGLEQLMVICMVP
jgi:hypothetical protein